MPQDQGQGGRGAPQPPVVAGLAGQDGEQVAQPVGDEPQPASLAVAAQQDLGHRQADQLAVGRPGSPAWADTSVEQLVDGDVPCDDEVVEDGAHGASLEVSVVVATPILGDLASCVTVPHSCRDSASVI
jgi:hypothetical protein